MMMRKSTVALLIAASMGLTGCLDDPYNYKNSGDGNTGGGDGPVDTRLSWGVYLYHDEKPESYKDSPYDIEIVDNVGTSSTVDGNLISLDNVDIKSDDFANFAPLKVTVSDDKATLRFIADEAYNLNITYNGGNDNEEMHKKGSLQFKVKPSSLNPAAINNPGEDDKVWLRMASGDDVGLVDISSAFAASKGADKAQHIKVPMKCFEDAGVDMLNVDMAMSLETNGPIHYEFSEARLMANSVPANTGTLDYISCEHFSQVETDDVSVVSRRYADTSLSTGWAVNARQNGGKAAYAVHPQWPADGARFIGIRYEECTGSPNSTCYQPGNHSYLAFDVKLEDAERIDLSHYMEEGALEFYLNIPAGSQQPQHTSYGLRVKFDASKNSEEENPQGGFASSNEVKVDLSDYPGGDITYKVSIPMKELFTINDPNHSRYGDVRFNALQRIDKLTSYMFTEEGNPDFTDHIYTMGDIVIVKERTQNEQKVQVYPQP